MKNKAFRFMLQLFNEPAPADPDQQGLDPADAEDLDDDDNDSGDEADDASAAKYTDEDLERILKNRRAKWEKQQEKAVSEAARLAAMNEQQKLEHERDKALKELEELKNEAARSAMAKQARGMLKEKGIVISDSLVEVLVTSDADETKTAVEEFIQAFNTAVEDAVKEKLKGKTPPSGGKPPTSKTKAEIMAIKDTEERRKAIAAHPHLFGLA